MKWSKLKKQIKDKFCESLKRRVELRSTRYRRAHDHDGKGWITIDKREVFDMCTFKWMIEYEDLASEIRKTNNCEDWNNPDHQQQYDDATDQTYSIIEKKGLYSQYDFYSILENYLTLSIENAIENEDMLTRALAMIDKRFGKRQIRKYQLNPTEHKLVRCFYDLRCDAEGIGIAA